MKKFILLTFLIVSTFFVKSQNEANYIISRGDVIDVVVMEHPEFSLNGIIVLPDGYFQYPGLGSILAAGMSSQQLTDTLTSTLQKFVVNPIVSIFIRKIFNQKLNIYGYVNAPGQYQVYDSTDIFSAIGLAGGLKKFKKVRIITIIRADRSVEEIKVSDYFGNDLSEKPIPFVNVGDTIYVREPREVNWSKLSFFTTLAVAVTTIIRLFG
jgi:polysaccharide export outer membrane protein